MPIKTQGDLPVKEILERENIFVMDEKRAMHQDIRPIHILILNLMPLKEGQYYVFDIIGIDVYDLEGRLLGKVTDVLKTGSNDVYVVNDDAGNELLLAVIPDVIRSVDIKAKKMVVNPPEWIDE